MRHSFQHPSDHMADKEDVPLDRAGGGASAFATTHWSVVLEAASDSSRSQEAFARLYGDYWFALYAYLRRRGLSHEAAEDTAQDFLINLLEKRRLAGIEREGGRFRSFLLSALKNFLANAWDRTQAQKRGGGQNPISLDDQAFESRYLADSAHMAEPEAVFERQWALAALARAHATLADEQRRLGKGSLFRLIEPHLQGDRTGRPYAEIAVELGMSEGAIKVAVHRLRHRFSEILRTEIGRTVEEEADIQDEIRHLIRAVSK